LSETKDVSVRDSHPKKIRCQIFKCSLTIADRFDMYHPVLRPYRFGDLIVTPGLFTGIAELGTDEDREGTYVHEEVSFRTSELLPVFRDAASLG
jgi:hypothetical protein